MRDFKDRVYQILRDEKYLNAANRSADFVRKNLRSDNGPKFIAKEVQRWLAANQIKTIYIEPGSPWQTVSAIGRPPTAGPSVASLTGRVSPPPLTAACT